GEDLPPGNVHASIRAQGERRAAAGAGRRIDHHARAEGASSIGRASDPDLRTGGVTAHPMVVRRGDVVPLPRPNTVHRMSGHVARRRGEALMSRGLLVPGIDPGDVYGA